MAYNDWRDSTRRGNGNSDPKVWFNVYHNKRIKQCRRKYRTHGIRLKDARNVPSSLATRPGVPAEPTSASDTQRPCTAIDQPSSTRRFGSHSTDRSRDRRERVGVVRFPLNVKQKPLRFRALASSDPTRGKRISRQPKFRRNANSDRAERVRLPYTVPVDRVANAIRPTIPDALAARSSHAERSTYPAFVARVSRRRRVVSRRRVNPTQRSLPSASGYPPRDKTAGQQCLHVNPSTTTFV